MIAFTRVSQTASAIFTYDTSVTNAQAVEIAPQLGSNRQAAQIGGNTMAVEPVSGRQRRWDGDHLAEVSEHRAPCDVWTAVRSGTRWTAHQLTSNLNGAGECSHPDTNGQLVVYLCDRGSGGPPRMWQVAEDTLNYSPLRERLMPY